MTLTSEYSFKGRIVPELQKLNIVELFPHFILLSLYTHCRAVVFAAKETETHQKKDRHNLITWTVPSSLQRALVMASCWTLGRLAIRDQSSLNEIVYFWASL